MYFCYIVEYVIIVTHAVKLTVSVSINRMVFMRVALLEDEPAQAEMVIMSLQSAGHECKHFSSGKTFIENVTDDAFDLLIMDWNVPDLNGPEALKSVRKNLSWQIPVLFTTSRSQEEDIVFALDSGADDYMIKPLKKNELISRINSLLRRASPPEKPVELLTFSPYIFARDNRTVSKSGVNIELTHKEFDVALHLFQNNGNLLSRKYLLKNVWGQEAELNTRTVDTHISNIRKKLGINPGDGWRLSSVYQHGYRLENLSGTE